MGEFELIKRYFLRPERAGQRDSLVAVGIGDDCALLQPRPGTQLAISCDMLVEGRHFFSDVDPESLGHKALAVNLSDLAACGAKPLAFTLALALPSADPAWLAGFSRGLLALADLHGCELLGGDTTQGPLNICITVFGEVPWVNGQSQALLRSGAKPGDDIYVSGSLGQARLALDGLRGSIKLSPKTLAHTRLRLERPTPRVALGLALRGIASAAIDVSDGLLGDLSHVLTASKVGASITLEVAIKLISNYATTTGTYEVFSSQLTKKCQLGLVLAGGDDYELAFTAPASRRGQVEAAAKQSQTCVTRIGQIDAGQALRLLDAQGQSVPNTWASFDHFA